MESWKIKINSSNWRPGFDVFIFKQKSDGTVDVLSADKIKNYEEGAEIDIKSSIYFDPEIAQEMATALNEIGINPKKEFVEGKLEAQTEHLNDLRKLLKLTPQK